MPSRRGASLVMTNRLGSIPGGASTLHVHPGSVSLRPGLEMTLVQAVHAGRAETGESPEVMLADMAKPVDAQA
jgi:hypothetical protein